MPGEPDRLAAWIPDGLGVLLATQNSDGGWGAVRGARSNTETTALGLLALVVRRGRATREALEGARGWLVEHQRPDGAWPLRVDVPEPSWTTALAVLALANVAAERPHAIRGAEWLVRHEPRTRPRWASLVGRIAGRADEVKLDGTLEGWPWTPDTASWVEPTVYALLALRGVGVDRLGRGAARRVREAELMLADRACEGGGWNYGNSVVLGTALPPYPDDTALALIALHDHLAADGTRRALEVLRAMLRATPSGLALAWKATDPSTERRGGSGRSSSVRTSWPSTPPRPG